LRLTDGRMDYGQLRNLLPISSFPVMEPTVPKHISMRTIWVTYPHGYLFLSKASFMLELSKKILDPWTVP